MNKLFFFDIDGTLVDCDHGVYSIPQETRDALNQLKEHGHHVFLSTGRCKCFILDGVIDYDFDGYVTCNGACVEYQNEILYKSIVPTVALEKTYQLCKDNDFAFYFENSDSIYVLNKNNPRHIEFKNKWGMKDQIIIDDFDLKDIEVYIGMIVLNNEEDVPLIEKELTPYFHVQRHQHGLSFDLTLKGESKGKGIKKLVSTLKLNMKDTVAFGDGRNDIEMISTVELGIAMGNAASETKGVAKYITDNVDNNGIVKALYHFHFIS